MTQFHQEIRISVRCWVLSHSIVLTRSWWKLVIHTTNRTNTPVLGSPTQKTLSCHLISSVTLSRMQNFAWGRAFVNLWGGGNIANTYTWWWSILTSSIVSHKDTKIFNCEHDPPSQSPAIVFSTAKGSLAPEDHHFFLDSWSTTARI